MMGRHTINGAGSTATNLPMRIRNAVRWRVDALRSRIKRVQAVGVTDYIRCRIELGFALPDLGTMQNYERMKFLHDCIVRFAPSTGVALEVGCYKCSSTVFIAKACTKKQIDKIYGMDLFTGTPSWKLSVDYYDTSQQTLAAYGLQDRVTLIRSNSLDYPWQTPIAALHIDGDHACEAAWLDTQKYTPFLVVGGIVVFDDYDISHPGVTTAVHRLLLEDSRYEVVAANYQGAEFGSVCLRRMSS
jgi:predicted O-methyltransferase YrrM